ncbi:NADH dehydrogenase subunit 2 (mitochondrion) [Mercenaria mercenaria]|uniref:NADH-ubiquinone oxidoreductase chain 2 n=1 Tax=Mercenaria mercenaria TaxID=6596 RepID=A0A6H0JQT6_MERMC|nr:NADH dehydrogenase subunit 2 [Mercenaria mercenaria]QIU83218.1 NADH dehydrogenase subunit 2 [Mercenaria mercenaria]
MVFYSVSSVLSLSMTFGGILISLVSLNMLGLWVGIEMNFLGAICYMSGVSLDEGESMMKYFVVQVMGSCFMVLGLLMMVNFCLESFVLKLIIVGTLLKLGVFPFHFWVASVMSGLSWSGCFVVSVLQKFVPLWLLSNLCLVKEELSVLEILASLTSAVGCLGGLGVLSYRVLLAYSSLVNLGILVILCCVSLSVFWFYMGFYLLLNLFLMVSLSKLKIYFFLDLVKEKSMSYFSWVWWTSLYFFSLAGLPPFSGCVLKVYFLLNCWNCFPVGCMICIFSSVVSLYFYLSVILGFIIFWGKSLSNVTAKNSMDMLLIVNLSIFVNIVLGFMLFLWQGV